MPRFSVENQFDVTTTFMMLPSARRMVLSSIFLASVVTSTHAQVDLYQRSFLEVKTGIGGSLFFGDLGGSAGRGKAGFFDWDIATTRQNYSAGLKINLSNSIAVRGDVFHTTLTGNDAHSGDRARYERNLNFKTELTEMSFTVEFLSINLSRFMKNKRSTWQLYTFAGYGLIRFNPQGYYKGQWVDLQPLGTEGQGILPGTELYSLTSHVVPFGFGFRKDVLHNLYIGFEVSMRKSFTDYIDDVSGNYADKELIREHRGDLAAEMSERNNFTTPEAGSIRGNPNSNDNYSFVQLTLAKGFGKRQARQRIVKFSAKRNHGLKCPNFKKG